MITVVCIGTEHPGNMGAIARVMKNFGFSQLMFIDPACDHTDEVARCRAKHANDILSNAQIGTLEDLKKFDYCVGLIGDIGTDYNIPRSPISPEELSQKIAENPQEHIALVFGPEGTGLQNDLVRLMDFVVTISTAKECTSMNLSHAVCTILYEVSKVHEFEKIATDIEKCGPEYKRVLLETIKNVTAHIGFDEERKETTQHIVWQKIVGKSMPTKREAFALIGFFKQMQKYIEKNSNGMREENDREDKGDN